MFDAFKKWTLFHHTFTFVKLSPSEVESLGAGTQQFLDKEEGKDGKTVMVGIVVAISARTVPA